MAVPDSSPRAQSFPSRNPRRRQRKESEEGGSLRQQPQRKRSKLSKDVFTPIPDVSLNGNVSNIHTNGHSQPIDVGESREFRVPVREKRAGAGKKVSKDDGSVILSKTPIYIAKQLPNLPSALGNSLTAFRGHLEPSNGYALVLTQDQAVIWDASSTNASSSTRSFSLPHPSKDNEPLPIGALVTAGSGKETGLVVISSVSGIITFWESIENAYALSLFSQHRNGIEAHISGLFSGEVVVSIESADHAGFILVFSTGRTAQLTLRDSQSRPAIAVNFLRDSNAIPNTGLFGGLRNIFGGGGWVKDVVAARPRQSQQRGHMEVLLADKNTSFQLWEISWSGQAMLKDQFDAKEELEFTLRKAYTRISEDSYFEMQILDFAFVGVPQHSSTSITSDRTETAIDLAMLVAIVGNSSAEFALVELSGSSRAPVARRTIMLQSYAAPLVKKSSWRPRLYLPRPYHTAFVIFEQAVVLTSWLESTSSPDTQLQTTPKPFQDTIYFRENGDLYVVGAGEEEEVDSKKKVSSVFVFVRNFGLTRITALEPDDGAEHAVVTAKSKIEQAIYYGTKSSNPLDLIRRSEMEFDVQEVEQAALEISNDVLRSSSQFAPPSSYSTEQQLEQKMRTLEDLARHLRYKYPGISRAVRWRLRWNAEKMAAAHQIWLNLGSRLDEKAAGERLLLPSLIKLLNERFKTPRDLNTGEKDPVRHFFAKDVWRIERIIPWAYETVSQLYQTQGDNVRGTDQVLSLVSQADDLVLGGLETAFAFRIESAELYGLENEVLVDGVLQSGYEGLPEFWTSEHNIIERNYLLTHLGLELAWNRFEISSDEDMLVEQTVKKVAQDNARLVKICCECYEEAYRWHLAQENPESKALGRHYEAELKVRRREMLTSLPKIGQVVEGMSLAEKYRDMDSLVYLVAEEADYYRETLTERNLVEAMAQQSQEKLKNLEERITVYFRKFGAPWRDAFFTKQIGSERFATLLEHSPRFKAQVTDFLRDKKSRAKLSWINDILQEKDYQTAGSALVDGAAETELNLWSKKVELSLAKLALVAAREKKQASKDVITYEEKRDSVVQIIKIQERLLGHIHPTIYSGVDAQAEVHLAMEMFGQVTTKDEPALHQLLERAFENLISQSVMDPHQLIDVLTLMDSRPSEMKADDISGQEFCLALQVLKHAYLHRENSEQFEMLLKMIWRRCMIRDDWETLNDTENKSDEEIEDDLTSTILFKTFYHGESKGMWKTDSTVQAPAPKACLGIGTNAEDYEYRFPSRDLQGPIARDVALEDERLASLIDHARLEYWQESCKQHSSTLYTEQADYEAEQGAKAQKVTQQIHEEDEDLARGGRRVVGGQDSADA